MAVNSHNADALAALCAQIEAVGGLPSPGATSVPPGMAEQVLAAASTLDPLDEVVNDAGVNRDRTVAKMTDEEWRSVLTASLDGSTSRR